MNYISLAMATMGILFYIGSVRRSRMPVVDHKKVIDSKLNALFFVYIAIAGLGMNYPLVIRHQSSFLDVSGPAILFWIAFIVALPQCIILGMTLHRLRHPLAKFIPILGYVIVGFLNFALLTLLNGAADLNQSQHHLLTVDSNEYVAGNGRSSPRYLLLVNDWRDADHIIQLSVSPELYHAVKEGGQMKVEIGSGALGVPWIKSTQRMPEFGAEN